MAKSKSAGRTGRPAKAAKPGSPGALLREIREGLGLNQVQFADQIGRTRTRISRYEDGSEPIPVTVAERLRELYGIDPSPLILADKAAEANRAPAAEMVREVPIISWVSAGKRVSTFPADLDEVQRVKAAGLPRGSYFATEVVGDSMDRISPEGSLIFVNYEDRDLMDGNPYVFSLRGETTYKLWQSDPDRLEPFSTSPANRTVHLRQDEEWEVIGRVRRTVLDL